VKTGLFSGKSTIQNWAIKVEIGGIGWLNGDKTHPLFLFYYDNQSNEKMNGKNG